MTRILLLLAALTCCSSQIFSQHTYQEISLPELMKKKKEGDPDLVIVDVRSFGEFHDSISRGKQGNIGRIKDAIHIELREFQQNPAGVVKTLEPYKDKDIYLICSHSYRSRTASNILLRNGFMHINNVRGGMTEWYRRYDELSSYSNEFLKRGIIYKNMGPVELLEKMSKGEKILIAGIRNNPRFWYDSAMISFYQYFPVPANAVFYDYADSLKLLEVARKSKTPVVLFNMVNSGAAELAEWMTAKGVKDVSYLVGGGNLLYETAVEGKQGLQKFFKDRSKIHFISPVTYCKSSGDPKTVLIDLRHDSVFNKVNRGTKHDFKHIKNAISFPYQSESAGFEQRFPDKQSNYVFVNDMGMEGFGLADALSKKGYKVSWLIGGLNRWEWYMNNVEDFKCNDLLVK